MSSDTKALLEVGAPGYLAGGDPELADDSPAWLHDIADDATVEGSMLTPWRAPTPSAPSVPARRVTRGSLV